MHRGVSEPVKGAEHRTVWKLIQKSEKGQQLLFGVCHAIALRKLPCRFGFAQSIDMRASKHYDRGLLALDRCFVTSSGSVASTLLITCNSSMCLLHPGRQKLLQVPRLSR